MACGLPVVTTPVSGIPELLTDRVNGLFVPPDDAAATADALHRLYSDPPLARQLASAACAAERPRPPRAGHRASAAQADVRTRFCGDRSVARLIDLFAAVTS